MSEKTSAASQKLFLEKNKSTAGLLWTLAIVPAGFFLQMLLSVQKCKWRQCHGTMAYYVISGATRRVEQH
jgi:hypothetical protein